MENIEKDYKEIQDKYDFVILKYILKELINPNYDKIDLCYRVNMAVINEKFTEKEGKIIKQECCL